MLRRLKASQTEREEGLESHQKKTGTPTMGGVIFLLPVLIIGIFYGASHKEVIPVLILTLGFGIIGFLDDYIKDYLPALLSEYDDLNKDYAQLGSFSLNDSQITWNTDGEEMQETWVMQDNLLIFSGTTDRVYRRL